jgi:hypothetical protein
MQWDHTITESDTTGGRAREPEARVNPQTNMELGNMDTWMVPQRSRIALLAGNGRAKPNAAAHKVPLSTALRPKRAAQRNTFHSGAPRRDDNNEFRSRFKLGKATRRRESVPQQALAK